MKRCFSAAVDHDQQPVCQIRMKWVVVASDPEEIIQGDVCRTSEVSQRITEEQGGFLDLPEEILNKSVANSLCVFPFGRHGWFSTGQIAVGHRFHAHLRDIDSQSFHD